MFLTQRLSPKNQVTIPREARALLASSEVDHVRGVKHAFDKIIPGQNTQRFPVLILMTEKELQRREQKIIDDVTLSPDRRNELVTKLNGEMSMMAIDSQRRIVLPPHFVAYLKLDREIFFVCTNTTIQAWRPDDYLSWSGRDEQPAPNPALSAYLMI